MTDMPELKPFSRLPPLPDEVFADPGVNDWYFREQKPDSAARYVRADLVAAERDRIIAVMDAHPNASPGWLALQIREGRL